MYVCTYVCSMYVCMYACRKYLSLKYNTIVNAASNVGGWGSVDHDSYYLSRNVKIASKPNSTPFTMDSDALISARSRVRVRNENSQASIMKIPLATNRAQPRTLKKMSMRLWMGARIRTPGGYKSIDNDCQWIHACMLIDWGLPANTPMTTIIYPVNVPVAMNEVIMSRSLKL